MKKLLLAAIVTVVLGTSAFAQTETTSTVFSVDETWYRKDYVWDNTNWTSFESLFKGISNAGPWTFVASLYTDMEANWTGKVGEKAYADQWNDAYVSPCGGDPLSPGDWEVVIGADQWRCWGVFSEDLALLHFWDDAVIYYGGGIIAFDTTVISLSASSGDGSDVTTEPGHPSALGFSKAMSNAPPSVRVTLIEALQTASQSAPHTVNAQPGSRRGRSGGSGGGGLDFWSYSLASASSSPSTGLTSDKEDE